MISVSDSPIGIIERSFALLIDWGILIFASIMAYIIFGNHVFINLQVIAIAYFTFTPLLWSGYTIGKRVLAIRIAQVNNSKLTFPTMFLREVIGVILYQLTLGLLTIVSIYLVTTRDDRRSVHDLIAGTFVTSHHPD
ncbi:RDD family protein [Alkalibacillus haloalkaliphilus]|uniref:RDD family protein n=1 Tax=Alkalibacillus haloalkaliphilus TaxID=94136 RepID=UPI0029363642|nr:RDD family protein [Alkalibacillus haloalkaliphilus]MDV2582886.1 RDD family protein [Alkalibacillus haloalkaliphilus]